MSKNWDKRMIQVATLVSSWSKDRSIGVGCVIASPDHAILSTGFNGFPRGVNDDVEARYERPAKYKYTEHAERNAIYNAARHGIRLEGSTMYLRWYPCADCARAIVQSGIKNMISDAPNFDDPRWGEDFKVSKDILLEGGVTHIVFEEEEKK